MQKILSFFLLLLGIPFFGISQGDVVIRGTADSYVGENVSVFYYTDYISRVKTRIDGTIVKEDSTFQLQFQIAETQKLYIEIGENNFSLYVQPNGDYKIYVTGGSPYMDQQAKGVEAEFYFLDLDSNDINYKILVFEDEQLNFLKENYNPRALSSIQFVTQLEKYKEETTERYKADTSRFFKTYIRYTIANLDNIAYMGERNEYEKYDFYLKNAPVYYQNDRYMEYLQHYYQKYEAEISEEAHRDLVNGIYAGSPSIIMNGLGKDYTLGNIRIRELIMIKMLSEIYSSGQFYKKGIIQVLDSLSEYALYTEHKGIAQNIKFRLLHLVPGTEMPEIELTIQGKTKSIEEYRGKHTYFQFVSKEISQSITDIKLLEPIRKRFDEYINYVTILVVAKDDPLLNDASSFIKEHQISWDFVVVTKEDELLRQLGVTKFPYYLLIDATARVVAAPALSPRPNNQYQSINNVLASISRYYRSLEYQR